MSVKVIVQDRTILILRVGGAAQVRVQESPDVIDVGAGKRGECLPGSPRGRSRIAHSQLVLGLVERGVRRIEISVKRREGCECGAFADHGAGWNITDDAEVGI